MQSSSMVGRERGHAIRRVTSCLHHSSGRYSHTLLHCTEQHGDTNLFFILSSDISLLHPPSVDITAAPQLPQKLPVILLLKACSWSICSFSFPLICSSQNIFFDYAFFALSSTLKRAESHLFKTQQNYVNPEKTISFFTVLKKILIPKPTFVQN